jgi:5-methylthioribose kinase
VIFHEPYINAPNNKWTNKPSLNEEVASLQCDDALKAKVGWYHYKFQSEAQALLHGTTSSLR